MIFQTKYLIIGQGIAGSALAWSLQQEGADFLVVDNGHKSSSTVIAPGLFNPVVFKRLTKSWKADQLLSFAKTFYRNLERELQTNFYHEKPLFRIMASVYEQNTWEIKSNGELQEFLLPEIKQAEISEIIAPFGKGMVKKAGYINTAAFISAFQNWLLKHEKLIQQSFSHNNLIIKEDHVIWKAESLSIKANKVIFCEGFKAINNPWFSWMPFSLAKGETITVKCPALRAVELINKNIFIQPLGSSIFRVGSTYNWEDLSTDPTEKGKNELSEKLKTIISVPFEVIDQHAGIRPAMKDRRPVMGLHPNYPQLAIFNGLGTKGITLAPYFSSLLSQHLTKKVTLPDDIKASRFYNYD